MSKINSHGISFDNLSKDEAVKKALSLIAGKSGDYRCTPNSVILSMSAEDEKLKNAINSSAMVLADGMGVVAASKIRKTPLKERVAGIDFAASLLYELSLIGGSVFLFGSLPNVANKAAENISTAFPGIIINGVSDGYYYDEQELSAKINEAKPDLLMVCLGAPKQEMWMQKQRGKLKIGIMAGLGGSIDVFAGESKRAPLVWQKLRAEWLYRMIKEPKRFMQLPMLFKFICRATVKRGERHG